MRERGVDAVAMEVSSHALVLGRVDGCVFDVAVFTNLGRGPPGLPRRHGGLLRGQGAAVHAGAGQRGRRQRRRRVRALGWPPSRVTCRPLTYAVRPRRRLAGRRRRGGGRLARRSTLRGPGRAERIAASVAAARRVQRGQRRSPRSPPLAAAGLDAAGRRRRGRAVPGVPGRMERVDGRARRFLAVVDYAHKPDAVDGAPCGALRPVTAGPAASSCSAPAATATRASAPLMGAAAARLADVVVVTDDNPRSEDPAAIRAAMLAGRRAVRRTSAAGRRVRATGARGDRARARARRGPGDTVLVAGQGPRAGPGDRRARSCPSTTGRSLAGAPRSRPQGRGRDRR